MSSPKPQYCEPKSHCACTMVHTGHARPSDPSRSETSGCCFCIDSHLVYSKETVQALKSLHLHTQIYRYTVSPSHAAVAQQSQLQSQVYTDCSPRDAYWSM